MVENRAGLRVYAEAAAGMLPAPGATARVHVPVTLC